MSDRRPPVSVVIPTVRPGRRLELIVDRLCQDDTVGEVVLVDDRPAVAAPLPSGPPELRVVRTGGGAGPNRARQAGVEHSSGEIVLLLDDDVVPEEGLASGHVRHHATPGRVVVGYMPVPIPDPGTREPLTRALYRREYEKRVSGYDRDGAMVLSHLWGGNVSLHRTDALRVGIVAPEFGGYRHEDREFGIRCVRAGLVGVFDRRLRATHDYQRSTWAFLDDARAQSCELAQLRRLYGDDLAGAERLPLAARIPGALRELTGVDMADPAGGWARRLGLAGLLVARRVRQRQGAAAGRRGALRAPGIAATVRGRSTAE